jgi:hypothetical protein
MTQVDYMKVPKAIFSLKSPPIKRSNWRTQPRNHSWGFTSPKSPRRNRTEEYCCPPAGKLVTLLKRYGGNVRLLMQRVSGNSQEQAEQYLGAIYREFEKPGNNEHYQQWRELVESYQQARIELLEFTILDDLSISTRDRKDIKDRVDELRSITNQRDRLEKKARDRARRTVKEKEQKAQKQRLDNPLTEEARRRHEEIMARFRGNNAG